MHVTSVNGFVKNGKFLVKSNFTYKKGKIV